MRLIDADALIQALEKKHEHWHEIVPEEYPDIEFAHTYAVNVIRNAPALKGQAESDMIYRADAIEAVDGLKERPQKYYTQYNNGLSDAIMELTALPSAEAEPTVIRSRTLMPTKDFKEWAKRIREENPNVIVIPCDAEVVSAEAVQGEWIWRTDIPIGDGRTSAGYICSNCGKDYWHGDVFDFCPNCGAKMKGGGDE